MRAFLIALLLLIPAICAFSEDSRQVDLIHPGCFHRREVADHVEREWLALYFRRGSYELASRTVHVEPCRDMADTGDQRTGRQIVIDDGGAPLFLVRGLALAGAEPVVVVAASQPGKSRDTALAGYGSTYVQPGGGLSLRLGQSEYQLKATGKYDPTRPAADAIVVEYRLTLSGPGGQSQDLPVPTRFAGDGAPSLVWAGDLDRDGKLDLYMDLTNHYNVRDYALLLSSQAAPRQLVKLVASRRYVGC